MSKAKAKKNSNKKADNNKKGYPKRAIKKSKVSKIEAPQITPSQIFVIKDVSLEEEFYTNTTVNPQITDSVTATDMNIQNNTPTEASIQPTTENADISESVDNGYVTNPTSEAPAENVSYNNSVVPQNKDNTGLYIGAAFALIVLAWILLV